MKDHADERPPCWETALMVKKKKLSEFFKIFICTLVEHLISEWALSDSQGQLYGAKNVFTASEQIHDFLGIYVILNEWPCNFTQHIFFNIHQYSVLTVLFGCYMAAATWNCCCLDTRSVYNHAPGYSVTLFQSHINM